MTTMAESLKQLETFTFDHFMEKMLEQVPEDIDNREGSIIYDTLAPVAYNLAEFVFEVKKIIENAYTQTAFGEFLDYKAYEQGVSREQASKSQAEAVFSRQDGKAFVVSVGDRFASLGDDPIFYTVINANQNGTAILEAEEAGSQSASYTGIILPVTPQNGLTSAYIRTVTIPGQDAESDDSLRSRLMNNRNEVTFGGNIADYMRVVQAIDGVSYCQVFPAKVGAGTVGIEVLDNNLQPADESLLKKVRDALNSPYQAGKGLGIAPIGHIAHVKAPELLTVHLDANIVANGKALMSDIRKGIRQVLDDYQTELRKTWNKLDYETLTYTQTVYKGQLVSRLMTVPGVVTVSNLTITVNGQTVDDIVVNESWDSSSTSQLITFGEVVLNA